MYNTVSLAWACPWVFSLFVFLPLGSSVSETFYSTERGKAERVLLEVPLLILLGADFLGLQALEKLLAQGSPVGNTPLCQQGSCWQ